jgi:hypothetical protein
MFGAGGGRLLGFAADLSDPGNFNTECGNFDAGLKAQVFVCHDIAECFGIRASLPGGKVNRRACAKVYRTTR